MYDVMMLSLRMIVFFAATSFVSTAFFAARSVSNALEIADCVSAEDAVCAASRALSRLQLSALADFTSSFNIPTSFLSFSLSALIRRFSRQPRRNVSRYLKRSSLLE